MSNTEESMGASIIVPVTGTYRVGDKTVELTAGEHALIAGAEEEIPIPSDDAIRQAAKHAYEEEGLVEIDDGAEISYGDDPGAYVQAWVWVAYEYVNCHTGFNPLLGKWLNDRDRVTADWPHNISDAVKREADEAFASPPASILDDLGWPMDNPSLDTFAKKVRRDGPSRVMAQSGVLAVPAAQVHNMWPSVVFIRDDGWSLGASPGLERTAHDMWPDRWIGGLMSGRTGVFNIRQLRERLGLEEKA